MAQYFVGAEDPDALSQLTHLFGSAVLSVVTDEGSPAFFTTNAAYNSWTVTAAGVSATTEVVTLMKATGEASSFYGGPAARASADRSSYSNQSYSKGIGLSRYDPSTRANLALNGNIFGVGGALVYHYRKLFVTGDQIKARIWADGAAEPSGWNLETTDSTYTQGEAGFSGGLDNGGIYFRFIGIGTNGDPAPTGPVSAVATPVNLGTINLLATSARLTWEQG